MIPRFIFVGMPFRHKGSPRFSLLICWTASSYWRKFFLLKKIHLLLLIGGDFSIHWRDSTTCFFILKGFFFCLFTDLLLISSILLSYTGTFLGSSFSFLTFCLETSSRTQLFFINFFMFKERGHLSRAMAEQDSNPLQGAICLRCQG